MNRPKLSSFRRRAALVGSCAGVLALSLSPLAGVPSGASPKHPATKETSLLSPLPSDASSTVTDASLNGVACTSSGNCVAVGRYEGTTDSQVLIVNQTKSVWGAARTLTSMPKNARHSADGVLNAVTCSSFGNCIAVGQYESVKTTGSPTFEVVDEPLVVTEVKGKWKTGMEAPQPPGAINSSVTALDGISCPKPTSCIAVGQFATHAGNEAFTVELVNGKWKGARAVTLYKYSQANFITQLDAISCVAVGYCEAVGQFVNKAPSRQALVVELAHGVWHVGHSVPLPSTVRNPWAGLFSIQCFSWGTCVAVGVVSSPPKEGQGLIEVQYKGRWLRGILAPQTKVPSSDAIGVQLLGVSCTGFGNCEAVGQYTASNVTQPVTITETKGKWGLAALTPRPHGAIKPTSAGLNTVVCSNSTTCVMVGQYETIVGDPALIVWR
jgi:hypothetical protein